MSAWQSFWVRFQSAAYTLMRFAFGVLFAFHGAQKLFGLFGGRQASAPLYWVAGTVEFFGGLAVALGLWAQVAAFFCAGQMLVAYFLSHFNVAEFPEGWIPIQNRGEMALLYFFGFLVILTQGPGSWTLRK